MSLRLSFHLIANAKNVRFRELLAVVCGRIEPSFSFCLCSCTQFNRNKSISPCWRWFLCSRELSSDKQQTKQKPYTSFVLNQLQCELRKWWKWGKRESRFYYRLFFHFFCSLHIENRHWIDYSLVGFTGIWIKRIMGSVLTLFCCFSFSLGVAKRIGHSSDIYGHDAPLHGSNSTLNIPFRLFVLNSGRLVLERVHQFIYISLGCPNEFAFLFSLFISILHTWYLRPWFSSHLFTCFFFCCLQWNFAS